MKEKRITAPKRLVNRIATCHVGVGLLVYKSGPQAVTQVEVMIDRAGQLRRIQDGTLVLPLQVLEEKD